MTEKIEKLCGLMQVSGSEGDAGEFIKTKAKPFADEIFTDALGSLIVHKKGNGKRLALVASMDGAGLMVTHINDNGTLSIAPVGDPDLGGLVYSQVVFQNGLKGVAVPKKPTELSALKLSSLVIDIGAKDRADAEKEIRIGDRASFYSVFSKACGRCIGPYLGSAAACSVLLDILQSCENPKNNLYFIFAVQGALGNRGAKAALSHVNPDIVISVSPVSGKEENGSVKPGSGAIIKLKDKDVIYSPSVIERLAACAASANIRYSMAAGEDSAVLPGSGHSLLGAVAFALNYHKTANEMIDPNDASDATNLLMRAIEQGI
jgi:putative aminopeptidase FrvX